MKKILKVFSILMAVAMIAGFTSCDDIFNFGFPENNENQQTTNGDNDTTNKEPMQYIDNITEVINHDFYLSDDKSSYIYYTSINSFQYGNHTNCVYQISFTPKRSDASAGDWKLYTRPRASSKTINFIYQGTFEGVNGGSVRNGGTVKLMIGSEVVDTFTISKQNIKILSGETKEKFVFTANVAAAHAAIDAKDEK